MAKKRLLGRARRNVRRLERSLRKQRRSDFRTTSDRIDAIFGNLRGTIQGRGRKLDRVNARTMEQMERLMERQRATGRRVDRQADRAAPGLMSGVGQDAFAGAGRSANEGLNLLRAQGRAGQDNSRTSSELVDIAAQGAREAEASAEYMTAQALQERGQADAQQVAAMEHDITMAKLQQQFQLEQMRTEARERRKMFMFEQEQAQAQLSAELFPQVKQVSDFAADATPIIHARLAMEPDLSDDAIMGLLVENGILSEEEAAGPQAAVVKDLIGNIRASDFSSKKAVVDSVMQVVKSQYGPGWNLTAQDEKQVRALIERGLDARYSEFASRMESVNPAGLQAVLEPEMLEELTRIASLSE